MSAARLRSPVERANSGEAYAVPAGPAPAAADADRWPRRLSLPILLGTSLLLWSLALWAISVLGHWLGWLQSHGVSEGKIDWTDDPAIPAAGMTFLDAVAPDRTVHFWWSGWNRAARWRD